MQDVQYDTWQNSIWSSNNSQMQAHKTLTNYAIAKCSNATLTTCSQQFWNGIQTDITLNSFSRKKAAWSLLVQINFVFRFGAPNKRLGLIMNSDGDGSSYGRSSKLIGVLKKLGTSVRWSTCMFVYLYLYICFYTWYV